MRYLNLILLVFAMMGCGEAYAATEYWDYELVEAGASAQVMGPGTATTRIGQVIERLIIVPETTGAGTVSIKDGSDTAINVLVSGTLSNLAPIVVELHARSLVGSWQITTGTNVHVIAIGKFNNQ